MKVGIEIGGTKLQLFATDGSGQVKERFRYEVDKTKGAEGILANISQTFKKLNTPITAVGVGFGGPINSETGQISTSYQIEGWAGFNLVSWLEEQTAAQTIRVENDANVAALGEALHGAGRGYRHVFYVTVGSGIGGGMIVDGQIYHGALPGEAELGHLWLVPPGVGTPGVGTSGEASPGQTLEETCSGWAVDRQIRELLPQLPTDSPLRQMVEAATNEGRVGGEARFLHPAYEKSDQVAKMLIEQVGSVLALGLSHVTHLFHPQVIVLGGGLSLIGEPFRVAVKTALERFVMKAFRPAPLIFQAQLREEAVPIGAIAML
jgi:glucokinase